MLILALLSLSASAHASDTLSVSELTRDVLAYLGRQQVSRADGVYVPGEWPSQVVSTPLPVMAGVGTLSGDEEPSAFSSAAVVNELEMIREVHPELKEIETLMRKTIPSFDRYREGSLFNFYPPTVWNGVRVHQARAMTLTRTWKGITNIPVDADTTSTVYTARLYASRLDGREAGIPAGVSASFEHYVDVSREPHWFNRKLNQGDTGAFMTWQQNENDPRMPRSLADPADGSRIPFHRNDVDCVVNMNVLRMMAVNHEGDSAGRRGACHLATEVVMREQYAQCGIYYPNTYNFIYSASQADEAGETCVRPYAAKMVDFILRNQDADGGWYNVGNHEVNDRVQSTAFAILSLERFAPATDERIRAAVRKGVNFLNSRMRRDSKGGLYWPGETFFTATALARSLVDWRSDAFTTVTALAAIVRAERTFAGKQASESLPTLP